MSRIRWALMPPAWLALFACAPAVGPERPPAERPAYTVGEQWVRSDGTYELVRIEDDRYIFAAGPAREVHLTKDLAVAKARKGPNVVEFDPPPRFAWPLEVGGSGSSEGIWRTPVAPQGTPSTFAWTVDAHEEIRIPAGTFQAFKIRLAVRWPPGARFPREFQFWFWYAPDARRLVKAAAERPGLLDFEVVRLDRPTGGAAQAAREGPGPPALSGASLPDVAGAGGKRYGLELFDALEAVQRGEATHALSYYERAAQELDRQGRSLEAAKAHSAVAFTAFRLGAYQKVIRSGLRALDLFRAMPPSEEVLAPRRSLYSQLAGAYNSVGELKEARRYAEEGLLLAKTTTDPQRAAIFSGMFLAALARVAGSEGNLGESVRYGEEAVQSLESFLRHLPPRAPEQVRSNASRHLARSLVFLVHAQRQLGNLGKAEAAASRAASVAKAAGHPESESAALLAAGHIALDRQDYVGGLARFQEAEAVAERAHMPGDLLRALAGIGLSYARQRRPGEALAAFKRAVDVVEDLRAQLQEAGLRGGFLEDKQAIYHGAVRSAMAVGDPAEAFAYAERARARAFLDLLGNQTVLSKGRTRALADEEVRLRAQLAEAQALTQEAGQEQTGDRAQARRRAEAAQHAYRAFLDRVRKESLEQASLMTVEPVTVQEVQRRLPEGVSLLEYLVTQNETVLWVIGARRVEVVRIPIERAVLLAAVGALRQAIETRAPLPQVQDRARLLYDQLLGPARPHLRGDRLLIVPHDVLHYLPFGALRSSEGRWLVEDYTLGTLPSASVLKFLGDKGEGAAAHALAVGNPDVGSALNLRYAEREAKIVGERYPGSTVLVRQAATETKVKALSEHAGLLHFATHGELNERDPLSSALLLVPEGQEDGRLEVREIFGLDLKARLVVLSACETGLGKLSRGDELVGLQRAFLYAGTPAVVTTLWKVDDRASYRLMEAFYDALEAHGPAAALRQSQRATMAGFPHPFAWAAFGLTGVPR